jgi:hypothetical protein
MNVTAQRLCAWCGPVMVAVWASAFAFLSRFIPPPAPSLSAAQIVARFSDHTNLIRFGWAWWSACSRARFWCRSVR